MNIPAVDKLCATIDIENFTQVTEDLMFRLEGKKEEARLAATNNASQKTTIQLGNQLFEIYPNGTMGYAYILRNDACEVKIARFRSKNENFYPIYISISSELLWSKGAEGAWHDIIRWVNYNVGAIKANKISRLDLCCHTDELILKEDDTKTFLGRFNDDVIYRYKRKVNAMYFGSRKYQKILCRIYDKTLEVKQSMKKLWFFDVWQSKGMNTENVWNIEFELNRDYFHEVQIDSVEDAFERINTLWEYCTKQWLVKKNLDNVKMTRCTTNEIWAKIQDLFSEYRSGELIRRDKQLECDAYALVPGTIGNITSYAARNGIDDINKVMDMMKQQGRKYLFRKDKTFEEAINEKMSLLGQ